MTAEAPWVERLLARVERDRRIDGKLPVEDFAWLHLPCNAVDRLELVVNSDKIDPASGDPLPVRMVQLHCNKHNVSSQVEKIQDQ